MYDVFLIYRRPYPETAAELTRLSARDTAYVWSAGLEPEPYSTHPSTLEENSSPIDEGPGESPITTGTRVLPQVCPEFRHSSNQTAGIRRLYRTTSAKPYHTFSSPFPFQ